MELVRVAGVHTGGAFVLAGPVIQGAFQYTLNYIADYSGALDGYFLQSTVRQEVEGAAAVGMGAAAIQAACSSIHRRIDPMTGDKHEVWVEGQTGSAESGADSGLVSDGDHDCFGTGASTYAGPNVRIGAAVRSASLDSDLTLPVGTATLKGNSFSGEIFATYRMGNFFSSAAVGYTDQDFEFLGSVSGLKTSDASGMYGNLLAGVGFNAGSMVHMSASAILDYNDAGCVADCMGMTGLAEVDAVLTGMLKLMATATIGHIDPYLSLAYSDVLSGGADVAHLGATANAYAGEGKLEGTLGVKAQLTSKLSMFAEARLWEAQSVDASGDSYGLGLRLTW